MREASRFEFAASPLYRMLAAAACEDERLLALAAKARPRQHPPFMLFAAVHDLVLRGVPCEELAAFYASAGGTAAPSGSSIAAFRGFALAHEEEITRLIASRSVSKTDLRRGACLRALLIEAAHRLGADAVHLVDVGCSAGLNLLLDRWRIAYGGAGEAGPEASRVRIATEVRGKAPPLQTLPAILSRTGIDLARIDPGDPEDERWILAHLFPEETALIAATREAFAELRRSPPDLREGDAIALLPEVVDRLQRDAPVVVMHSLTLAGFGLEQSRALAATLKRISAERRTARIYMEKTENGAVLGVAVPAWQRGTRAGTADLDGRWMSWELPAPA